LYLFAAADGQAALVNWKTPGTFNAGLVNTPAFTADRGFTGNGSNAAITTGYTPSIAGAGMTQNSAHVSGWSNTAGAAANTNQRLVGNSSLVANRILLMPRNTGNIASSLLNSGTVLDPANTLSDGHFIANRSASNAAQVYRNGTSLGSGAPASTGLSTASIRFLQDNATFSTLQISSASIGQSLNATQAGDFYTALRAYMTAVGVP
jgi:hypothetical protein